MAALCIGTPLLMGWYFGRIDLGASACLGGLVILYLPRAGVTATMVTLITCSFGFMVSHALGLLFSFNANAAALTVGAFSGLIHWIKNYFGMRPPGNFFFIMLMSVGACQPFHPADIPMRIGLLGLGTMFACLLALAYSLYRIRKGQKIEQNLIVVRVKHYTNISESLVVGSFAAVSLLAAHALRLGFPYWVPISCLAVMQGIDSGHILRRGIQRVSGTFLGLGLATVLLKLQLPSLGLCLCIILLQFTIEMLVVRNYALAVVFITPLTIFLAETTNPQLQGNGVILHRFWDIALGSFIGALGGWLLHHRRLHYHTAKNLIKLRRARKRLLP